MRIPNKFRKGTETGSVKVSNRRASSVAKAAKKATSNKSASKAPAKKK